MSDWGFDGLFNFDRDYLLDNLGDIGVQNELISMNREGIYDPMNLAKAFNISFEEILNITLENGMAETYIQDGYVYNDKYNKFFTSTTDIDYWIKGANKTIPIKEMTTQYIINCINLIKRKKDWRIIFYIPLLKELKNRDELNNFIKLSHENKEMLKK